LSVPQIKEWIAEEKINLGENQKFGFYVGGGYVYKIPYAGALKWGYMGGLLDVDSYSVYCYLRNRPQPRPWGAVFVGEDGPVSSPGWEGTKDGSEIFEYFKMLYHRQVEAVKAGNTKKAAACRAVLGKIFGEGEEALIREKVYLSEGQKSFTLEASLEKMLMAKELLLKTLSESDK